MNIYKYFLLAIIFFISQTVIAKDIVSYDYYLKYQDELKIHLKEKKINNQQVKNVVVLINSVSIPFIDAFDVPGYSLIDALAENGFDVWGIDFLGQGKSSPSKELLPLQASEAVPQLAKALEFISQKTGKNSVTLLGWSWGSIVAAKYAIEHPAQVDHLILYGAMYSASLPKSAQELFLKPYTASDGTFNKNLPAYQNIPWNIIKTHWQMMTEGNAGIAQEDAFNAVGKIYPATVQRPMGSMKDLFLIWHNQPLYNIHQITTPTLVIYGDQDIFADKQLFAQLTGVKNKKEIKIKEATHWLIYERNRFEFYNAVTNFIKND